MLFSYKRLSTLVDLSTIDEKALIERLTFSGFEVEGVEHLASASNLVIGEILTCENHPDSDHLHLLTVDTGEGIRNIVCGAPNARIGLKVILALPGCELPAIGVTIKPGMIRGQMSDGMCCSLVELGVDKALLDEKQVNGIEELPSDAPVGEHNVLGYLGLDDTILDINVLPNRPDCFSYVGMAREISALFSLPMKEIPVLKDTYSKNVYPSSATDKCNRFDAIKIINAVPVDKTPEDIVRTLQANGIRSLSPIVDLGNYSMLLSGQPLNMYDADKNPSDQYIIRDDFEGVVKCFDGKEISLIKGDLVVCNEKEPLCLAGIMALENAAVTDSTKNIVIEAASFYHANIRHTSARLGLTSFSSNLFAKGRNPKMISEAVAITLSLLPLFFKSYEVVAYASYDVSEKENKPFAFSYDALNARLGSSYTHEEIDAVLKAYRVEKKGDMLYPPKDRVDLKEQCDIDEEVFRFYPASKIQPTLVNYPITHGSLTNAQKLQREIRSLLVDRGLDEILSFTLISEKEDASIRVFSSEPSYKLVNPMTKDHEVIRSDLLPSMLATLEYNVSRQHENLALFEVSDVHTPKGNHKYLSIGLRGNRPLTEMFESRPYDFFDMKGLIEAIFNRLGIASTRYRLSYSKNPAFHPGASADVFMGKDLVATFGQLHPNISKDKIFLAEVDLGFLFSLKGLKTKFTSYASFPTVRRNLSFRMNEKVTYEMLKKEILRVKNTFVKSVDYFDDYYDKDSDSHYLGLSLLLGKEDGTLTDAEINASMQAIVSSIKATFGLTLRGE